MKRAYRERALGGLTRDLASSDFDTRELAMFQVAAMLRRESGAAASDDWTAQDSEILSRDLLRIRLTTADQGRIVADLERVMERHASSRATAIWVLGATSVEIGCPTLKAVLQAYGHNIRGEAAFQVCRALRGWLDHGDRDQRLLLQSCADSDILQPLARWSRSDDNRLATCAKAVIHALHRPVD